MIGKAIIKNSGFIIAGVVILLILIKSTMPLAGIVVGLIGLAALFVSFKYPQYLMYLLILAVTNIFGIYNILEEYRLPGIGKPSDFILVLLNLLVIVKINNYKVELSKTGKKLVKVAIIIAFYIFFLIFYSSVIMGRESFNYALRTGAAYLYYTSFLFPIYLVTKPKQLVQFINFLRIGGLTTGAIAIISNIVGYSIVTGVISAQSGPFVRVYLPFIFNYFVVVFWSIQFITKSKIEVKIHYLEAIISALGIILFLGRTLVICVCLSLLMIIWFLSKYSLRNKMRIIYLFAIFAFGLILSFVRLHFNPAEIIGRFQLGYTETLQGTSTFSDRLYLISAGYRMFSQTPLFGTGFIHPTSNYYSNLVTSKGFAIANSADFGLASILFTTGIIGFGLITYFVIANMAFIKGKVNLLKEQKNINLIFIYSFAMFAMVVFIFFVEQLAGNEFAYKSVAVDLVALGFAVKMLSGNIVKTDKELFVND